MSVKYRTKDGDQIDAICWKHYGRENVAEAVLEANPRLADYGLKLPAGIVIILPDLDAPAAASSTIKLWD